MSVSSLIIATIAWSIGLSAFLPQMIQSANAATFGIVSDAGGTLDFGDIVTAHTITFGASEASQTLTSITLNFTSLTNATFTNTAVTSNVLEDLAADGDGGIILVKDQDANGVFTMGGDAAGVVTLSAGGVYGVNTYSITPDTPPTLADGDVYFVLLSTKTVPFAQVRSFSVEIPDSGIVTSGTDPTVSSTTAGGFTIGDNVAPTATSVGGPGDGDTGVPVFAPVNRIMSEAIDESTVTTSNVTLIKQGGGSNLCDSATLTATTTINCGLTAELETSSTYTFTLTTGITDVVGNALASNQTYTFTTGEFDQNSQQTIKPSIVATSPVAGATNIGTNQIIIIEFDSNASMTTSGANGLFGMGNVTLKALDGGGAPTGSNLLTCTDVSTSCNFMYSPGASGSEGDEETAGENRLYLRPGKNIAQDITADLGTALSANTSYQLRIESAVQSTNGVGLGEDFILKFSTGSGADSTGPSVLSSFPANNATNVSPTVAVEGIQVTMNEPLYGSSVATTSVALHVDTNDSGSFDVGTDALVQTNVAYDSGSNTIQIAGEALLATNKKHFIVMKPDAVKDASLNAIDSETSTMTSYLAFTTVSSYSDSTKPTILYAEAGNFQVVLKMSEPMDSNTISSSTVTLESPVGTTYTFQGNDPTQIDSQTFAVEGNNIVLSNLLLSSGSIVKVTVTSTAADLSGNVMDPAVANHVAQATVVNMQTAGADFLAEGMAGTVDYAAMWESPVEIMPERGIAGQTSRYRVTFEPTQAIPSGGQIMLDMPKAAGMDLSNAAAVGVGQSFANTDLNGLYDANQTTPTIASVSASGNLIIVTTGGAAIAANDLVSFELEGIVNPTIPRDYTTTGYVAKIKTKNDSGVLLESLSAMPFFINAAGSRSVSGTVFNDNGAGAGTAGNNVQDGSESGIEGVEVWLDGPSGFYSAYTDGSGDYTFSSLLDGSYGVSLAMVSSTIGGSSYVPTCGWEHANVNGGNATNKDLAMRGTTQELTVNISGGPASAKVDVRAFNSSSSCGGGDNVREVTLNGSGAGSATMPVYEGEWEVIIEPWMPKFGNAEFMMPDYDFSIPKPQAVTVASAGNPDAIAFALKTSNQTINGQVQDGSDNGIANVFIVARPAKAFDTSGNDLDVSSSYSQTQADGSFNLNVNPGMWLIEAHGKGIPSAAPMQVEVYADTGNSGTDNNANADVYVDGALVTAMGGITIKLAKAGQVIQGKILDENGNAIDGFVWADMVDESGNVTAPGPGTPTDDGTYALYVESGGYEVKAHAPGYGEFAAVAVNVVDGEDSTGVNFQADTADFGTVTGQVTKNGTAVSGAHVFIFGQNGGNMGVTDDSGNFSLNVNAGAGYTIEGFVPGSGPLSPLTSVTVTAGQTNSGNNLSMGATGTIEVTLGADYFVSAFDSSGLGDGTNKRVSGKYTLTLPAGTYTLRAFHPAQGEVLNKSVTVTAGETTAESPTEATTYAVTGRILVSGSNASGATVLFIDEDNGRVVTAVSDTTSGASDNTSASLPDGTYKVLSTKAGYVDDADAETVTVSGGATTFTSRTLELAAAAVAGSVTLNSANTTVETRVVATNGDKIVVADVDTTENSGDNYSLKLTNGTWTLKARGDGYESAETVVVVSGGSPDQSDVDFTLSAISGYTAVEAKVASVTPSVGGVVKNDDLGDDFALNLNANNLGSDSSAGSVKTKKNAALIDTASGSVLGGFGYSITPLDANGNKITDVSGTEQPTITLPIDTSAVSSASADKDKLQIGVWDTSLNDWTLLATTVDSTNNTMTASVPHFSDFAPIIPPGGTVAATANTNGGSGGSIKARPSSPTEFYIVDVGDGKNATLHWDAHTHWSIANYVVYRSTDGQDFGEIALVPVPDTEYAIDDLVEGETYYYAVAARRENGVESLVTVPIKLLAEVRYEEKILSEGDSEINVEEISAPAPEVTEEDLVADEETDQDQVPEVTEEVDGDEPADEPTLEELAEEKQEKAKKIVTRAAQEFKRIFGRDATSEADKSDLALIEQGQRPEQRNEAAEKLARKVFDMVLHIVPTNEFHDEMIDMIAYGGPVDQRNLNRERQGIGVFGGVFRRLPDSTYDWNIVRFISYFTEIGKE